MKSCMSRVVLGRMLHDLFCEETKTYRRWETLTPAEQESACRVAEAFCWNAAWPLAKPRAFYARVSLMGHRSIGLCRVTEAPLAGVTMLRCEKDGGVEWVNPAAVYSIAEVPDAAAEAEIASARRHAQEVQAEAERRAVLLRSEREGATVDIVVDHTGKVFGAIASESGLLRLSDSALSAAIAANGLKGYSFSVLYADDKYESPIGISAYAPEDITDRLVAVMRDIGFSGANVRESVGDELVPSIPF